MKFRFWWYKHAFQFFFLKKQKVSETSFLNLKIFRWLRKVLFSLDLFFLQIRVSEKDRENLHFFFTERQNWNTLTRLLCQVFFLVFQFKKSIFFDDLFVTLLSLLLTLLLLFLRVIDLVIALFAFLLLGKDQKNPGQNFPDHFRIEPNICGLKLHTLI